MTWTPTPEAKARLAEAFARVDALMRSRYGAGLPGFEAPTQVAELEPPPLERTDVNPAKVEAVNVCETALAEPLPDEFGTPAAVWASEDVRRRSDLPCRHCGAVRFEVLQAWDERGRHWDVERCGCRY